MKTGNEISAKKKIFNSQLATSLILFLVLFCVYSFRSTYDLQMPYMWQDEANAMISYSVYHGFNSIFIPCNGGYWVIQRLISTVCYYIVMPIGKMSILPQMISFVIKVLATFSVFYFTSSRFEFILKGKYARFLVCVFVMLLIPTSMFDVVTCSASVPFLLFFLVFLMGLEFICAKELKMPSWWQTIFLVLLCASYPAAPLIAAVCGIAALRWLIVRIKAENFSLKDFAVQASKLLLIFAATLVETLTVLSSGRASSIPLDLWTRIKVVSRIFVVLPYSQKIINNSIIGIILALAVWAVAIYLSRIPKRIFIFGGVLSWLSLFISSMTVQAEQFKEIGAPRYFLVSYEIATLLLFVIILQLLRMGTFKINFSIVLVTVVFLTCLQNYKYNIDYYYPESALFYKTGIQYFAPKGTGRMVIPVGPWAPLSATLPVEMPKNITDGTLKLDFKVIDFHTSPWSGPKGEKLLDGSIIIAAEDGNGAVPLDLVLFFANTYHPSYINSDGAFRIDLVTVSITNDFPFVVIWKSTDGSYHEMQYTLTNDQLKEWKVLQ